MLAARENSRRRAREAARPIQPHGHARWAIDEEQRQKLLSIVERCPVDSGVNNLFDRLRTLRSEIRGRPGAARGCVGADRQEPLARPHRTKSHPDIHGPSPFLRRADVESLSAGAGGNA